MKSHRNDVLNLSYNAHMRIKIYQEFYHCIIYIANEGRHIRIFYYRPNTIQLLHLNEINMRFYGAEYNNIERGEDKFNIVVLCSIKPHIDQVQV